VALGVAVTSIRDIAARTSIAASTHLDTTGRVHHVFWQDPDFNLRVSTQAPSSTTFDPAVTFIDSTITQLGTLSASSIDDIPHVFFHARQDNNLLDIFKCWYDMYDKTQKLETFGRKAAFDIPTYQATVTYGPFSISPTTLVSANPTVLFQKVETVVKVVNGVKDRQDEVYLNLFNYNRNVGPEWTKDKTFGDTIADVRTSLASAVTPDTTDTTNTNEQVNALFVFYTYEGQLNCRMRAKSGKWCAATPVK